MSDFVPNPTVRNPGDPSDLNPYQPTSPSDSTQAPPQPPITSRVYTSTSPLVTGTARAIQGKYFVTGKVTQVLHLVNPEDSGVIVFINKLDLAAVSQLIANPTSVT